MKKSACVCCNKIVEVKDNFDQWSDTVVCSTGCKLAEMLFRELFSDISMNRRAHYLALTQGEDYE